MIVGEGNGGDARKHSNDCTLEFNLNLSKRQQSEIKHQSSSVRHTSIGYTESETIVMTTTTRYSTHNPAHLSHSKQLEKRNYSQREQLSVG